VDTCLTAAVGLNMVDNIQGAGFFSRALLLALRAGEPRRLVRALVLEGSQESIGGSRNRRRTEQLLGAAEQLARETDEPYRSYLSALVLLCRGAAADFAGDWPGGQRLCDEAEAILHEARTRAVRVGWMFNLATARCFALWSLYFMGDYAEIARRLPRYIKDAQQRDDLYGETNFILLLGTVLHLAADEPGQAREDLRRIMGRWSRRGFHLQHLFWVHDEAEIDMYEGDGLSARRRLAEAWPLVEQSHLLRSQKLRIYLGWSRARAALVATTQVADAGPYLQAAERDAQAMGREGVGWAGALAQMVRAGVAATRGDLRGAAELLRDAAERCDATAMRGFAALARFRLGELLGGTEGQDLIAHGIALARAQQIRDLDRFTALLLPGFGRTRA
jgi:hypothetical protein